MVEKMEHSQNQAVKSYKMKNQLIQQLKKGFTTYGYEQVHTPTFEDYDMYASIQNTLNTDEMIKVIDRTGKILVLRPDGTIPITRLTASERRNGEEDRLFYIFNVYRQLEEEANKESTQAGVELFGNKEPEADAEVISLAVHTLKELGFQNFKLEIGHAGFFKELIEKANLSTQNLEALQELIQSKNMVEMKPFLAQLDMPQELEDAFYAIPLLYGKPEAVLDETQSIIQNKRMQAILSHLTTVMDVLQDDGSLEYITLNLGLINNMDYYTDIIFQGFVDKIGKPVLMGGRYDQLSEEFGKQMPAIGFAYEVDALLQAMKQHQLTKKQNGPTPIYLYYVKSRRRDAFKMANALRLSNFRIITKAINNETKATGIHLTAKHSLYSDEEKEQTFNSTDELVRLLEIKKGEH